MRKTFKICMVALALIPLHTIDEAWLLIMIKASKNDKGQKFSGSSIINSNKESKSLRTTDSTKEK